MANFKYDIHANFIPEFYREALRSHGIPKDPYDVLPAWSIEEHMKFNACHDIKWACLSIGKYGTYLSAPDGDDPNHLENAIGLTRRVNEYGSDIKDIYGKQFGFFASLPLPNIEASLQEIDYCCKYLSPDGFLLQSSAHGLLPGDPSMGQIYSALHKKGAIIAIQATAMRARSYDQNLLQHASQLFCDILAPLQPSSYGYEVMLQHLDAAYSIFDLYMFNIPFTHNIRWIIPQTSVMVRATVIRLLEAWNSHQLPPALVRPSWSSYQTTWPGFDVRNALRYEALKVFYDTTGLDWNSESRDWSSNLGLLYGSGYPLYSVGKILASSESMAEVLVHQFGLEAGQEERANIAHRTAHDLFMRT